MHRIILLVSVALLVISAVGFANQGSFPGPLLALLGILIVLSSLASPALVYYSAKDLYSIAVNKITLGFLALSVVYFVLVIFGVYKVWPQLISV